MAVEMRGVGEAAAERDGGYPRVRVGEVPHRTGQAEVAREGAQTRPKLPAEQPLKLTFGDRDTCRDLVGRKGRGQVLLDQAHRAADAGVRHS